MKKSTLSLGRLTITEPNIDPFHWLYITPTVGGRSVLDLKTDIRRGNTNATLIDVYTLRSTMTHGHVTTLESSINAAGWQVAGYVTKMRDRSEIIGNLDLLIDYNAGGVITFDDLMRIADKLARAQLTEMYMAEGQGLYALADVPRPKRPRSLRPKPPAPAPLRPRLP